MGPNPTDRGTAGSKRHLVTDRAGVPLAVLLMPANTHDSVAFEDLLDAVPPIERPSGHRRKQLTSCTPTWATTSANAAGSYAAARLGRYRRLTVRYERRAEIHQTFLSLGCALICWNYLQADRRF